MDLILTLGSTLLNLPFKGFGGGVLVFQQHHHQGKVVHWLGLRQGRFFFNQSVMIILMVDHLQ